MPRDQEIAESLEVGLDRRADGPLHVMQSPEAILLRRLTISSLMAGDLRFSTYFIYIRKPHPEE